MSQRSKVIPFHEVLPVGGTIKVRLEPSEKLSSIIEVISTKADGEKMAREFGVIQEMGSEAFGHNSPKPDLRIKVGDLAIFRQYAGMGFDDPNNKDNKYRIMNDDEVWGFIPKETLDSCGYDSSYAREGAPKAQLDAITGYVRELKSNE